MDTNYSSVFDGTPLVMATPVSHYRNRTVFSQVPCILEWTTANRIRAIDFDSKTNQMVGAVLDIDPWEWVLTGGEDHTLLATTYKAAPSGFREVGRVMRGTGVTIDGEEPRYSEGWEGFA